MSVLGEMVRRGRRATGLSQRGLAARCQLNQSTISRLENGNLRHLRLLTVARVLGVLYDPLLGDAPRLTRWS
jgi:transcriptional regulator with XRE-family HTH domain